MVGVTPVPACAQGRVGILQSSPRSPVFFSPRRRPGVATFLAYPPFLLRAKDGVALLLSSPRSPVCCSPRVNPGVAVSQDYRLSLCGPRSAWHFCLSPPGVLLFFPPGLSRVRRFPGFSPLPFARPIRGFLFAFPPPPSLAALLAPCPPPPPSAAPLTPLNPP